MTSETAAPSTPSAAPTASGELKRLLTEIPDFPKPGILFRDLTPVFADADAFRAVIDDLAGRFVGRYDAVAGVEARGFLLASALAYASHTPLAIVRKAGKLPGEVLSEDYGLEYGAATLEIRPVVLIAPVGRASCRGRGMGGLNSCTETLDAPPPSP